MPYKPGAWTEDEIKALAELATDEGAPRGSERALGAREMAEALVEMGIEAEVPAHFVARKGELAIGSRVVTPADGAGRVVEYAERGNTIEVVNGQIVKTPPDPDVSRLVVLAMDDGLLRAEDPAGLTAES